MSSSDSIISGLTSFPTVATWVSCVPLLLMMAFMGTCKDIAKIDFSEQISLKGQGMTGETGGFVAHIFFMTGEPPLCSFGRPALASEPVAPRPQVSSVLVGAL